MRSRFVREVVARLLSRSFSRRGRQAPFVGIINEESWRRSRRNEKHGDHPHAADERNGWGIRVSIRILSIARIRESSAPRMRERHRAVRPHQLIVQKWRASWVQCYAASLKPHVSARDNFHAHTPAHIEARSCSFFKVLKRDIGGEESSSMWIKKYAKTD